MDEPQIKREMPRSIEAEEMVLGSMLLDNDNIAVVENIVMPEDFSAHGNAAVYGAMLELYEEGRPVDAMTLADRLREKELPPEYGDYRYIADMMMKVPLTANAKYYAEIVADKALMRRLIRASEDIANTCYAGKDSIDDILGMTEKTIFDLLNRRREEDYVPIRDIALAALERIHEASRTKNPVTGIPTGFIDLDRQTAGLHPSDLVLIAARPSMGKTAFALNIAAHAAFKKDMCVAIFSLEMSREQLVSRLFAMESRVDSNSIRTGNLTDDDWERLIEGVDIVGNSKLIIDDTPGISVSELRTKCRKYKLEFGLKLVMIDYLQLMSGSSRRAESRQQEITEISRSLKAIARELEVPVIALSQLNRSAETRSDHRPMLSDLRESGAIEQDADVVMMLFREDYYNKDTDNPTNIAEVIIAKQRNGPVGTVQLAWLPQFTKFANIERP
ncbi:MAG: replicative DNA helicase [Lachnospiraceae bacterium]|nr:replicative DNA helicase [Lachnospiraceae bacterium]